jgi:hypothetical protein
MDVIPAAETVDEMKERIKLIIEVIQRSAVIVFDELETNRKGDLTYAAYVEGIAMASHLAIAHLESLLGDPTKVLEIKAHADFFRNVKLTGNITGNA